METECMLKITKEEDWPYGKRVIQGHLLIERFPLDRTSDKGLNERSSHQINDGTARSNSHVFLSNPDLKIWDRENVDGLTGPIVDAPTGFHLEHPIHNPVLCELPGRYVITYTDYVEPVVYED